MFEAPLEFEVPPQRDKTRAKFFDEKAETENAGPIVEIELATHPTNRSIDQMRLGSTGPATAVEAVASCRLDLTDF
jgi:hypothetical protein